MAFNPTLFPEIFNGPWTPLTVDPLNAIINGTETTDRVTNGNDKITLTSILNLTVNGNSGNDFIDGRAVGVLNFLNGGTGSDQIYGGAGVNTIDGGDGNDYIDAGAGLDILTGGAGSDTVSFESLRQLVTLTLDASGGGVAVSGLDGDTLTGFENVVGTALNDTITGNAGANKLIGMGGNDILSGGGGNDTLNGGAGNDTIAGNDGNDVLDGGDGVDTLDYSAAPFQVNIWMDPGPGQSPGGYALGDTIQNFENIIGSDSNDFLFGTHGANRMEGRNGDDTIDGRSGDDIILAGNGNDTLDGESGNDTIDAGAGNDTIKGSFGNDTVIGGLGADTMNGSVSTKFIYNNSANFRAEYDGDKITGFDHGIDKIDAGAIANVSGSNVSISAQGGGTYHVFFLSDDTSGSHFLDVQMADAGQVLTMSDLIL